MKNLRKDSIALVTIAFILWISCFLMSSHFGFYMDDYSRVPAAWDWDFIFLLKTIKVDLIAWRHGRPLHEIAIHSLSFLGGRYFDLNGLYFLSYLVTFINGVLAYFLFSGLFSSRYFGLTGALALFLLSGDNTQTWLTSSFGIQPALTFILIAFNLYRLGYQKSAYLSATLSLLTYETFFLTFLFAPAFTGDKDNSSNKISRLVRHTLLVLSIFIAVFALRILKGDKRTGNLDFFSALTQSSKSLVIGPLTSISLLGRHIIDAFPIEDSSSIAYILIAFAIIFTSLFVLHKGRNESLDKASSASNRSLFLCSVGMLVVAYPLSLIVSASRVYSFATRVHSASQVGLALLFTCLVVKLAQFLESRKFGYVAITFILSSFLALHVAYRVSVQQSYALAWQYQQGFWSDSIELIADIEGSDRVIVSERLFNQPQNASSNTWATSRILDKLFQFPSAENCRESPRLYALFDDWEEELVDPNEKIDLKDVTPVIECGDGAPFEPGQVIWLDVEDGQLVRRDSFPWMDKSIPLKALPPTDLTIAYPKRKLYRYLIGEDRSSLNNDYLRTEE